MSRVFQQNPKGLKLKQVREKKKKKGRRKIGGAG
jgi:hypothetical protein